MLVKLDQVKKQYQDFELVCSLLLEEGSIIGLIGQNGAGKSTTFKAILNLIQTEGTCEVFGESTDKLSLLDKENIGVVLADSFFSGEMNMNDVCKILQASYHNFEKDNYLKLCEKFNIPMRKKIKQFSTGMLAKAKLIVALTHKAKLLILDEPTAGLDVIVREELLDLLRDYMEEDENRGMLISSHISSDLEGICDELYMIDKGKIVFHEETDTLLSEYGVLKLTGEQYKTIDKTYLVKTKQEMFGYLCLTNHRDFYQENYPEVSMEKGNIDELITMMVKGK